MGVKMPNTTIRVDLGIRDELDRFKLRLAGNILKNMSQADTIRVLLKLGDKYFPDAVEIAGKEK